MREIGSDSSQFTLSSEEIHDILHQHIEMPGDKLVSYLPVQTVTALLGLAADEYLALAGRHGLVGICLDARHCVIASGAIYVWKDEPLQQLLSHTSDAVSRQMGGRAPLDFIQYIAGHWVDEEGELLRLIRLSFGESETPEKAAGD